jgi:8-oxo-dGTP pyrophosphatase MutT (NUDIX family)
MRPRVAVYVIRRLGDGMELLVFDHEGMPEAGTQVPAGGIRPTESRKEAVLREVKEETGLKNVRVVTEVGIIESPHPVSGQPRRTSYWVLEAAEELPSRWRHVVTSDDGDDAMVFLCRWELLPLEVALADDQGSLLAQLPLLLG